MLIYALLLPLVELVMNVNVFVLLIQEHTAFHCVQAFIERLVLLVRLQLLIRHSIKVGFNLLVTQKQLYFIKLDIGLVSKWLHCFRIVLLVPYNLIHVTINKSHFIFTFELLKTLFNDARWRLYIVAEARFDLIVDFDSLFGQAFVLVVQRIIVD